MSSTKLSKYANTNLIHCKHQTRPNLWCVVCSAPAFGMNFNAFTCQSCKAFFRRNALKAPHLLQCVKNRSCMIDISSRRNCPACRLKKCLAAGMNRQLIQSAEEKVRRKQQRLEQQQTVKNFQEFPLPIEHPYRSYLTEQDHLFLNHIRHAYETRTHYFHPYDILPELLLNDEFLVHFSCLSDLINARSIGILRLIIFFKLAAVEFQKLNTNDKMTLVKFNIPTLFWLNISLSYNPMSNTFCEDEQTDFIFDGQNLRDFYGIEIYNQIIQSLCLLHRFVRHDPMIIYLLILILLFSHFSSCTSLAEPILYDSSYVHQTQNSYTNLLVRFLSERFGEQHANILLAKLLSICLNIQSFNREICLIESKEIFNENILSLMKVFLIK